MADPQRSLPRPRVTLLGVVTAPVPDGCVAEVQPRLDAGPFTLVPADRAHWALPGGGRATYDTLVRLARGRGWSRPVPYRVVLVRRPGVSRET